MSLHPAGPALPETPVPARAPLRRRQPSCAPLGLALAWVLGIGAPAWLVTLWQPLQSVAAASLFIALVTVPALALWVVAHAGLGGGLPLALIAGAVVFLSDATLRGGIGSGIDTQSAVKFGVWSMGLLLVFWRWHSLRAALRHLPSAALAAYALWCLLGSAYSHTPLYTAAASVAFLGIWVVGTTLALSARTERGLAVINGALLLAMALSLLLFVLVPERALTANEGGRILRLSGVFGSPNNLGRGAALALLLTVLQLRGLRGWRAVGLVALALGLAAPCLLMSGSRGSMLALAAGLAWLALGRRPLLLAAATLLGACAWAIVSWAPEWRGELMALVSRSGRVSEVSTLTGRTEIWAAVAQMIQQSPLLGYGFASTREVLPAFWQGPYGWTTTSAHNLWLQSWVTTGLLGLLLLLAAQAGWLWQALVRPHPARDAVVLFVMVVGIFEASAVGPSVNLLTFVWAWAAALGLRSPHER